MGDFQNAVFGQKQALFSWPPSSSAFMISIPWAWDVNKYQLTGSLDTPKGPQKHIRSFQNFDWNMLTAFDITERPHSGTEVIVPFLTFYITYFLPTKQI